MITVGVSGYIGLSFEASAADADLLEAFFLIHSTLAGVEEKNDGSLLYYIPFPEWTEAFQESLDAFCREHFEIEFLGSEEIEDHDWNAEWEATIVPQRATTELVITPSWKSKEAFEIGAKYTITIDPKMSFGTGHHETTRLCLKAIEEMNLAGMNLAGKRALDLGTGSGVLAMYALMRGAKHAVGIDTDSWSITNALENRALNNISESQFEIRQGTLGTAAKESESFDLILANLHRNILIENARLLRKHMAANAWLVLSGILMYDVTEIRAAFESERFTFSKELRENEWSCLIFQASK